MAVVWEQLQQYQPVAMKILANSLEKGRVAHAYLLEGQRGTGKREASLLFAKSLFCFNRDGYQPCDECSNCRRIGSRNHPDVHWIEPDGQSIKKAQIEALQAEFAKTGMESRKKLYVIVHADKMTTNAANSLLKFLEEPHAGTTAILLTEQLHRLLPTIISRCQVVSFQPLPPILLANRLKEEHIPLHFAMLAAHVTNNYEEALEWSRNDWFAESRKIVLQLYEALNQNEFQALLLIQEKWMPHFQEKQQVDMGLDLLLYLYRDILHLQLGQLEHVVYCDRLDDLRQWALACSQKRTINNMTTILQAKARLNTNMNVQLLMEQLILNLKGGTTFV
ncbi:DNA polymerase III subunit delta' [Anoxybacteroides amylolyticum]|uniref:DNA polymerase III subunit delta' n=1 Tax=Anoxybacteroides amylolyticum TaxID=294699 RepID=A0A160F622_9BACL|nr:DNA polymerase III subunit delta' [Anoxybacillus amylolyticus]ANB61233.1 DNA polymerase III, delta' subunit [Anoxybacillus amylolyticus]